MTWGRREYILQWARDDMGRLEMAMARQHKVGGVACQSGQAWDNMGEMARGGRQCM